MFLSMSDAFDGQRVPISCCGRKKEKEKEIIMHCTVPMMQFAASANRKADSKRLSSPFAPHHSSTKRMLRH